MVADIIANISAISRASNVVTVTTATPTGLLPTDQVTIAGVTDTSFNGTFPIASIIDSLHFTYAQTACQLVLERRHGGAGRLDQRGRASVRRDFRDAAGISDAAFAAGVLDSAGGRARERDGHSVRRHAAEYRGAHSGVHRSGRRQFLLHDGPGRRAADADRPTIRASSFVVDFSDTALLAGISADSLFQLVELGECAGVIGYSQRLFWWGERNKQNNWDNLTFDGGFGGVGNNVPLGWTPDATYFAGGSCDTTGEAIWGGAYAILGDGATRDARADHAIRRGRLQRRAAPAGEHRLFGARTRAHDGRAHAGNAARAHLQRVAGNFDHRRFPCPPRRSPPARGRNLSRRSRRRSGFTTIPPDLVLRVYADGTPTSGAGFLVDNIEIFPTAEPYNTSLVRASFAEDPESYDGVSGFMSVSENDGQTVRAAFLLRERLYFVKDRSIYVTEDDGVNEPASWTINEVSSTVGTPSVAGVDVGEDWAVIAGRAGHVHFRRRRAGKNFAGNSAAVGHDQLGRGANAVGARGHAQQAHPVRRADWARPRRPICILVLDYRSLSSAGEIESLGSVLFSTLSGKLYAVGRSRKWCPWNITANSCALAERPDGTAQVFLGNGSRRRRGQRKNLPALRHAIFRRRRGHQFLLHDVFFPEPRSRTDLPGALAPKIVRVPRRCTPKGQGT